MNDADFHLVLRRMMKEDQAAFEKVYETTKDHVYRTVYFLAKNKQDVGDMMSEVYIELFRSLSKYDFKQPFRSWLNGLVIRQVHNWHRKVWRKLRLFHRAKQLELTPEYSRNDENILQAELQDEIQSLIDQLSYKLKVVIVLRYNQEYSFEEIATILNIPLGTVKSRHHLAIQKLRLQADPERFDKEASSYVH